MAQREQDEGDGPEVSVGSAGTAEATATVSAEELFRVEIRAGRITRAEPSRRARKPSYKLWVDFGELGTKRSSAQLAGLYTPEDLVGRQVVAVTNLPPRQVADVVSEVLVLGVPLEGTDDVVLLAPDRDVPPGARVS